MDKRFVLIVFGTTLVLLATLCLASIIGMGLWFKLNNVNSLVPNNASINPNLAPPNTTVITNPTIIKSNPIEDNTCNISLEPGEDKIINAGCCIQGDVLVDEIPYFDSIQNTGHLVVMKRDGSVLAPYGASVTRCPANIEILKKGFFQAGACGLNNGCSSVIIYTVQ